jgi:alpha-1,6-mannosyltransferase
MLREREDRQSLPAAATAEEGGRFLTATSPRRALARRALGLLGLVAVPAGVFAIAAGAAGAPSQLVPARSGGWPGWLSGPLHGLGWQIGWGGFQAWTLVICAGYAAALLAARSLPGRAVAASILAANALLLLGPPLISQDVFGYLAFARLGVLHGLDPYTHVAAEAPVDAVFPFIGWPFQHSPYGPLFTLGSYPLAPLGLAGGLWALKAVAIAASLSAVALVALAARRMGRSGSLAAAFVGLNPVLLLLAVGGAHNDTLVLLALAGALALAAEPDRRATRAGEGAPGDAGTQERRSVAATDPPARPRAAVAALAAGVGVKASAGLVLPYLVLSPPRGRARLRLALAALASLALLAAVALIGFGAHAFGFLDALGEQQQLIASHSIPQETARWLGLSGLPGWWRDLFAAAFLAVLLLTLWRTARGADWRAMAGWATLALLLSTAWLLPWYAIWALPLAVLGDSARLRFATLAVCAYALLIHLPLADPLLSPPRHVIEARVPAGRPVPARHFAAIVAARRHDVVFAGPQVGRHAALDLGR